jgi:phosphopantothenoylcysteine decarboxylase / phosphopantothenate---cysteine ligase
MLHKKKIILGVTGGIAAYKSPLLVRLLVKQGAEVKVVMTASAHDFVSAKALSVLSKNEVVTDFFDSSANWNNHVHLAEWADLIVIAPLTANTLAKMANGACDSILLATYLSGWQKTMIAPAMDRDMYQHPGVQNNLAALISYGTVLIPTESGELASGLFGEGRMAEPETIVDYVINYFNATKPLSGKKALVNAGPTYEPIDPVRFIGNRSSGKMGIAIAEALAYCGAEVTLVLGPSSQSPSNQLHHLIKVETSEEMYTAMISHYANQDIVICSAAVADYKPTNVSEQKIKKKEAELELHLTKTKDILSELGKQKQQQFLVGFALETANVIDYAKQKLMAKNLDMVVANSAVEAGSGFGVDTNKITIIDKHNKITNFELKPKGEVACDIVDYIIEAIK